MAGKNDEAPVELVGDMPGKEYQAQERQKLRKTDESQVQHPSRDLIHLPADGHDDHLSGNGRQES